MHKICADCRNANLGVLGREAAGRLLEILPRDINGDISGYVFQGRLEQGHFLITAAAKLNHSCPGGQAVPQNRRVIHQDLAFRTGLIIGIKCANLVKKRSTVWIVKELCGCGLGG